MSNSTDYLRMLTGLTVQRTRTGVRPHKPCLLLAVIDLVESGAISNHWVRYTPRLRELFHEYFSVVATPQDRDTPYYPFFYLKSEPFWTLTAKENREADLEAIKTPSHQLVEDCIDHAEIDLELFQYMKTTDGRDAMREQLINKWFPGHRQVLSETVSFQRESNGYERSLRGLFDDVPLVRDAPLNAKARDRAFRRVVLEAYDYRCAASGWRMILPGSAILVEAAHLIPHSESHDDDPRNGIALTPNFHWLMDRCVIAPGPDFRWHVSEVLEERITDNHPLLELNGKRILTPVNRNMLPRSDALEWRMAHLLK